MDRYANTVTPFRTRWRALIAGLHLALAASVASAASSQWVYMGSDGLLKYKTTPLGDRIMDFSAAGYMGGGVRLPTATVKANVSPRGGTLDDTAAIQAAIDSVAGMTPDANGLRGAVLLSSGTFRIDGIVKLKSGVVLRGSGSSGSNMTKLLNTKDSDYIVQIRGAGNAYAMSATVNLTADYVPSGVRSFTVSDASAYSPGQTVVVTRTVTSAWIAYLGMDDLYRDGAHQTWISPGTKIYTDRVVESKSGNTITLDAPLTDSFDKTYLGSPVGTLSKYTLSGRISQAGVEKLYIECGGNDGGAFYADDCIDCWVKDVYCHDGVDTFKFDRRSKRCSIVNVTVEHSNDFSGSPPNDFHGLGTQLLFDRCQALRSANISKTFWTFSTGSVGTGPIVVLDMYSTEKSGISPHMRWTTGILADRCSLPNAPSDTQGIAYKNRKTMGSGHGWTTGWSVAWNVTTPYLLIQQAPGTYNWGIGCVGTPTQAEDMGTFDSTGTHVTLGTQDSLYLAQLKERLGPQALVNIDHGEDTTQTAAPVFSPAGGNFSSPVSVTMTSSTSGATIRYTTDGVTTPSPTVGTIYTGPVTVSTTTTLKAIAYASGLTNSTVTSATYQIGSSSDLYVDSTMGFVNQPLSSAQTGTFTAQFDATPSTTDSTIALCSGNETAYTGLAVIVRFNTSGNIDARNGSAYVADTVIPYTAGTKYHFRLEVNISTHTYSAYVTPAGGSEKVIGLNYAFRTEQATVSQLDTLNVDTNTGSITVSPVTLTSVVQLNPPEFDLPGGTYTSPCTVNIMADGGATVRYTTNGSTPSSTNGTVYTGPVTISTTTTLKAIAYGTGYLPSTVTSDTFTITNGGAPVPTWSFAGPRTFNGTATDYLDAGTSPGSAANLTVAFFATPAQLANMQAIDKLPTTGTAGWSVKLRSNGDLWFRVGSEGTHTDAITIAAYSANTRVHVACTFGGGTAKVYINGVLKTTTAVSSYNVANTTTALRLAVPSVAATTNIYKGVLDDVRVYNQALTAGQIYTLATDPSWTFDNAKTFNGTTDFVEGDNEAGTAASFSVTFFATASKLANMSPIDKLPLSDDEGWAVKLRSGGDIWFRLGSEATHSDLTFAGAYTAGTKVHIACTFGGGTAKVYINGVLKATKTGITYAGGDIYTPIRLGLPFESATSNIFSGTLEKVRVYDRALSAGEVTTLFNTP